MRTTDVGACYEEMAVNLLLGRGFKIVEQNFRIRGGEIDIVALKGRKVYFVEVKGRSGRSFGAAADSLTALKLKKVVFASKVWLKLHDRDESVVGGYLAVLIDIGTTSEKSVVKLIDLVL